MIHGGDRYRNKVTMDFSVNGNPLGMPEGVKTALQEAIPVCTGYPDPEAEQLGEAVSRMLFVKREQILFGNGASELFMAVVHALKPLKTVIPVPSFYGYEYAVEAMSGEIIYYPMQEKNEFALDEGILSVLEESVDIFFLANPNNPVGNLIDSELLEKIMKTCKDKHIYLILDECFIGFCEEGVSMISQIEQFPKLLLIGAFTKLFAIPGVRLGYLVSQNTELLTKIKRQLPEWNLSVFAQMAGIACTQEKDFVKRTAKYCGEEGVFLAAGLEEAGFRVFLQQANFIMIYTETALYDKLLAREILIRDCSNFKGLSKGYYRIAVRSRAENQKLLETIGEII